MSDKTVIYTRYDRSPRQVWESFPEPYQHTINGAAPECDINNVVARLRQGLDPGVTLRSGQYRDNTAIVDMKTNLDIIRSHESVFNALPQHMQERYKTPFGYYSALAELEKNRLEQQAGTSVSLDVTGPTDSKLDVSSKKGGSRETETNEIRSGQVDIQKSDSRPSEKLSSRT